MDARTAFLALLVGVLLVLAAMLVEPLIEYVLAACLLAVVLRPAYERLEPRVGPRVAGLACTGLAVVGGIVPLVLVSVVVVRTAVSTVESFDGDRVVAYGRDVARNDLGMADETVTALETGTRSALEESISGASELTLARGIDVVTTGMDVAVGILVVVFLLYYLLVDGSSFVAWLRDVAPLESRFLDDLFTEIHAVTWAVFRSHLFVAVAQGILGGLGLALLGVPYATTLAVVLVVASVLPTIGVWLVWGPVTAAHAVSSGPVRATLVLGYGVVVLAVADSYLRALLVDRESGLHPATALIGVIGGLSLFGVVGIFVGPVVLATFKTSVTVLVRIDRSTPSSPDSEPDLERERPLAETE